MSIANVKEFIEKNNGEDTIFVLKGFSVNDFGYSQIDIDNLTSATQKRRRNNEVYSLPIRIISIEEFIYLNGLYKDYYDNIYLIENNIYINYYPIDIVIEENKLNKLLNHFDDDADDEADVSDIDNYIDIYSNVKKINGAALCVYNLSEQQLAQWKVNIVKAIEPKDINITEKKDINANYISLSSEEDYYSFVEDCLKSKDRIYCVEVQKYIEEELCIKEGLKCLANYSSNKILLYEQEVCAGRKTCSEEVYKIMMDIWGYDRFRELKFYNFNDVKKGIKSVIEISQEDIVYDLIDQVEKVEKADNIVDMHDIFITAPTGAGKSLMFQLPAMYLANKFNLLTIVVSPLIALMKDQIANLEKRGYERAATINSDIPPILKQEIFEKVSNNEIDILYLSPESLLSKSDIEQIIGKRNIGLFVVDEAHIVTTWGKQFRPDYWFLGDYINKIRKKQMNRSGGKPFVIATFTATAIYGGAEDMYRETINSLRMVDPITYLGYVKRDNILIDVHEVEAKRAKVEYELDKFASLCETAEKFVARNQKVLIYFPLVNLVERCKDYFCDKPIRIFTTKYYGPMSAEEKDESIGSFQRGKKLVMLATKAFGMGIDIPDITAVIHFAPTGNVCDYMQEIGRAARSADIQGYAIYKYMSNDFKHINRLYGMSAISKWQLVEVISKILEVYWQQRNQSAGRLTKKKNALLIDVNSFSYIFETGDKKDESDVMAKVKTAMLMIQKDYERNGFAPFVMRPSPLFSYGFFMIDDESAKRLSVEYNGAVKKVQEKKKIYRIDLQKIWEKKYNDKYSFQQFKYLLYSKNQELDFVCNFKLENAMEINIESKNSSMFDVMINLLKNILNYEALRGVYCKKDNLIKELASKAKISIYKAENIINVFIASIKRYQSDAQKLCGGRIISIREEKGDENIQVSYRFNAGLINYFDWITSAYNFITDNVKDGVMYVHERDRFNSNQISIVLGLLEAIGVLKFKVMCGANSQLYIYVNETKNMQLVVNAPEKYKNRLLEAVKERHITSVKMLTYLFSHDFNSDQIWEHLENYFLGILPEALCR